MTISADYPYLGGGLRRRCGNHADAGLQPAGGPSSRIDGAVRPPAPPVGSFLVAAYVMFWTSWMPVLFLGAAPRLDLRRQTLRRGLPSVRQASRRLTS